jgi:signal transduction histidine kinase
MCVGNLAEARDELREPSPDLKVVVAAVDTAQSYAERVSAWGAFAVARIRHEKRKPRQLRLDTIVLRLLGELQPAFTATKTEVRVVEKATTLRAHAMDMEAIALNLLTNAYTFVQDARGARVVKAEVTPAVEKDRQGAKLVVADSGPGVPPDFRDVIWEPLYTTKRDAHGNEVGTGLGLAIVDSVVRDAGGSRTVDADPELKGARFTIWLPSD